MKQKKCLYFMLSIFLALTNSFVLISQARAETETSAIAPEENPHHYDSHSSGIFFGFSPVYKPSSSNMLDGSMANNIEIGMKLSAIRLGFLYANGSVPGFEAAGAGSLGIPNAGYFNQGPGTLQIYELYADLDIPITESYSFTGPFSVFIPIQFGEFLNLLKTGDGSRDFRNFGSDFAAGLGVQWYSKTHFSVGASALFHGGWPYTGLREDANSPAVQTLSGASVTGGNSTFELKLTLIYLFS